MYEIRRPPGQNFFCSLSPSSAVVSSHTCEFRHHNPQLYISGRSLQNNENRVGPKTDPFARQTSQVKVRTENHLRL